MGLKRYLPSGGFVYLSIVIIIFIVFFSWIKAPLKSDKVNDYEQMGHQLFQEKKFQKAAYFFEKSTRYTSDKSQLSFRLRCAATSWLASGNTDKSLEFAVKALHADPGNLDAINLLQQIAGMNVEKKKILTSYITLLKIPSIDVHKIYSLINGLLVPFDDYEFIKQVFVGLDTETVLKLTHDKDVIFVNRYNDGWTAGESCGIIVYGEKNALLVINIYSTAMPKNIFPVIVEIINGHKAQGIELTSNIKKSISLPLKESFNFFLVNINKSFKDGQNNRKIGLKIDAHYEGMN